jgi:hypothetical protein
MCFLIWLGTRLEFKTVYAARRTPLNFDRTKSMRRLTFTSTHFVDFTGVTVDTHHGLLTSRSANANFGFEIANAKYEELMCS